jgi:hypothetical protein
MHSFLVEGYVFFDVFTTNQQQSTVRMLSPVIDDMSSDDLCFTFWYFAFGTADSTQLHVLKTDPGSATGQTVSTPLRCLTLRERDLGILFWGKKVN